MMMPLQKRVFPRKNIFGTFIDHNNHELFSFPLFISFDMSWKCSRIRYTIWQQVSRFMKSDIIELINSNPAEIVKRNTAMSNMIRIFVSGRFVICLQTDRFSL